MSKYLSHRLLEMTKHHLIDIHIHIEKKKPVYFFISPKTQFKFYSTPSRYAHILMNKLNDLLKSDEASTFFTNV